MYSESSKQVLEARIGFGKHSKETVIITESNETGTSGRLLSFFHPLATVVNLYASVEDIDISDDDFNAFLSQFRKDAVASATTRVLNFHTLYDEAVDYSDIIVDHANLFDEVIGYTMAIKAIEMLISTTRINDEERNASMAYEKLKVELEGVVNSEGIVRSKGLNRLLNYSIRKAARIIFKKPPIITGNSVW